MDAQSRAHWRREMTLNIVPRKETVEDAPFMFVVEDSGVHGDNGAIYVVDCLVDDTFICGYSFISKQADYQANRQLAIGQTKTKAYGKLEAMRAEIARMQAIVDKVANHADKQT
jgi:hypothetical protein